MGFGLRTVLAAISLSMMPLAAQAQVAESTQISAEVATEMTQAHAEWSALLARYVRPHEDGVNRFDYGGLKDNSADRAALDAYIAHFTDLDFDELTRDEAFAAWANLYNALTVQHIVGRYPLKSIRSGYIMGPWKRVKTVADGREVSLDDIEHNILRVEWSDPRVHYAVNCASIGCPNLRTAAWEAATLHDELDEAARDYVNHARGVTIRSRGGLRVSTIYKWFDDDFGGNEAGVIAHLLTYASPELAAQIEDNRDIKGYTYDWDLNDVD